jgi:hypothetical protein
VSSLLEGTAVPSTDADRIAAARVGAESSAPAVVMVAAIKNCRRDGFIKETSGSGNGCEGSYAMTLEFESPPNHTFVTALFIWL